jgi:3-phenylpropionate/trans-cinnamate dioxygenase ferredoxin reductase component
VREKLVVVGASLGGVSLVEALQRRGYAAEVTLVGAEDVLPYDRPPLSKVVLTDPELDIRSFTFHPEAWYADNDVELVLGDQAVSLAVSENDASADIGLRSGRKLRADKVVIATGSRPRMLPAIAASDSVRYLRDAHDASGLTRRLSRPGHLLLIGAGFIGLEVAASAIARGWQVSIVERDAAPLGRVLPAELASLCWEPYARAGVRLECSATCTGIEPHGGRQKALLNTGAEVTADLVVVAVGGVPNVEWTLDSGLELGDGIRCDQWGRTSLERVWAVGDAACWRNQHTGGQSRVEQWQAAREQADVVAGEIVGDISKGWAEPPYFWSDLVGGRVQMIGMHAGAALQTFVIRRDERRCVGLVCDAGLLVGIFAMSFPRAIAQGRRLLLEPTSVDEARTWAENLVSR